MPESPTSSRRATRPRISARVASTSSARKKPSQRPVRARRASSRSAADRSCNSVAREPSASARAATVQAAAASAAFSYPSGNGILGLLVGLAPGLSPLVTPPNSSRQRGGLLGVGGQQVERLANQLHRDRERILRRLQLGMPRGQSAWYSKKPGPNLVYDARPALLDFPQERLRLDEPAA